MGVREGARPNFRERNPPDFAVPRRALSIRRNGRFAQLLRNPGDQLRVWRDRALFRIRSRLACRGTVRSRRIGLFSSPGVQARPRLSPPLPGVQDTVASGTKFAGELRAARGKLWIRPVARPEARRQRPLTTESSGNLQSSGHQAVWPQALDRRPGMQDPKLPAAPQKPARGLRKPRWPARVQREDALG